MTISFILQQTGLTLDIIGAILLFMYGLPSRLKGEEGESLVDAISDQDLAANQKHDAKIRFRAYVGIVFLILGFILQFLGNF